MQCTGTKNWSRHSSRLLSARPAVTPTTLKRAATNFATWWTEAQWVWTVCLRLLPDSVATAIWGPNTDFRLRANIWIFIQTTTGAHCGKCCQSGSDLAVHRRSHSGEKPFECTVCSKRFTQLALWITAEFTVKRNRANVTCVTRRLVKSKHSHESPHGRFGLSRV